MKPPAAQVFIVHPSTFSIGLTLCRKKITAKFSITNWCHNTKNPPPTTITKTLLSSKMYRKKLRYRIALENLTLEPSPGKYIHL